MRVVKKEISKWLLVGTLLLGVVSSCTDRGATVLERVKQEGYLVIATRYGPTTYYHGPNGEMGLEYELASRFARYLGVRIRFIATENYSEILKKVANGEAHFAAAGISVTSNIEKRVRFGPVYQEITQQVIYHMKQPKPVNFEQMLNKKIQVKAGTAHAEFLRLVRKDVPALTWTESTENETEELMNLVSSNELDHTLADSNEVATIQRYLPELRVAFNIEIKDKEGQVIKQRLAWAFPKSDDNTLYDAAQKFFNKLETSGRLEQIRERYYGHVDNQFNYYSITTIKKHIQERLPRYKKTFQREADTNQLDWRLLAAIGYQESLWDAEAVSPTGVRGIMMLTQGTAKQMKIADRRDPELSIRGGARYFKLVKKRIAEQVAEPDRTWFALAAYNVGIGHLEDAQKLAQEQREDPYKWISVRKFLPLLTKPAYYQKTRYGYARGYEPVEYVRKIRTFYDLLVRYDEEEKQAKAKRDTQPQVEQAKK